MTLGWVGGSVVVIIPINSVGFVGTIVEQPVRENSK
jgi:hypothetical protein